ncbi:MAG: hypothetical protein HY269_10020 [Deltaproteobacteria bacterium]|nr:hypothetical protein [Deltaproteobacteria bacterium]
MELKQSANAMDEFGYLRPGLLRSPDIRAIAGSAGGPSGQHGSFESLTRIDQRFYRAAGWAVLPDRTEAAHAVLLTYSRADGAEVLLSLADQGIERLDIARQTGESKYVRSGWEQWLEIPEGADRVKAWAYDALSGHAFTLAGDQHASAAPVESIQYKLDNGGTFDSLIPGESYTANGWAMLWEHPKRADRVLLTCGGGNELIATAAPSTPRPDVMVAFHDLRLGGSGWTVTFSASRVPAEGCQLKAWAWDRHDRKAMLLTPSHLIPARAP